jgi:hypothetical protein
MISFILIDACQWVGFLISKLLFSYYNLWLITSVQEIILHAKCLQQFDLTHNPNITESHISVIRHTSPLLSILYTPTKSAITKSHLSMLLIFWFELLMKNN